jgi:hypothetical protein
MVFRHYRELVRPDDAAKWFSIAPQTLANVIPVRSPAGA